MSTTLGELEQIILLALIRLGDDAYGVSVSREIARRTGRDASHGTVYKTLLRLETKGMVETRIGEPTPQRGGRRKKYYRVTPVGRRALAGVLRALRRMAQGLAPAWGAP